MARNTVKKDEVTTNRSKRELTGRLVTYLKPYKKQATCVVLLMIVAMVCTILNPYLLKIAIDTHVANKDIKGLLIMGMILVGMNLLAWLTTHIRMGMLAKITTQILVNIRKELYTHIQGLSFDFFDSRPVGKILARVMGDVSALQNLFNQSIQSIIPEILTLICVSICMFVLNAKLALACMIVLPVLLGAIFYIEVFSRKRWDAHRKKRSNMNGFTHEDFSGMKVVQAFAKEQDTAKSFSELLKEFCDTFIHAVKLNDLFWPLVDLSWGVGTVVVFYIGYQLVQSADIQIGTLLAFTMYVGMFWRPIMNLSQFYNTLITNFSAADRIFDILDTKPQIKDTTEAVPIGKIKGDVLFKNVSFAYEKENPVLSHINFKVGAGEKIALVGETGSGKTTIVSLLSRFYDCTEGSILIDGKDIKQVAMESLRSQMGIMLQDTFLFSDTIMENIRYGRLDATDEEVIAAAKSVCAHDFIMRMEKGYATEVNERGSRLSLGQRQLISFARALLANPRILILDEATSNIDTQTERLVQQGIEKLMKGRTCFVIAHRLSTIRDCDTIMVIEEGMIKEVGNHEKLLAMKGAYYNLYSAQYRFLSEGA
ncbi:MAG: ABC transporter ATP-binding protein [Cellulosilyticaceae bacterium]